ncbi:MAG: 30S ribosomal protein S8e [Candidatus Micrarchaeota archaeon]|nr:30S ribosomal protein S8e [Candidatus Micrarchaeota archaeon]MDE1847841.1 30S ribosomal protein S8e [Candidatus Micrarchaeota archaeon]MDE1864353.1 30S ribosomal protein S8e [Candidatus Micrarchaeota archaeon]
MSQFGVQLHTKPARKLSGSGKGKVSGRHRKRYEVGGYFIATKLGEKNVIKHVRERGSTKKAKLQHAGFANLLTKNGYKKVKITAVLESKDNRNFARLTIITKGAVIDTELGKAIVTNRSGREGNVNARLL